MSGKTYSDVLLEPQYSEVLSRSNVNISTNMGKFALTLPIISANMRDITGPKMVLAMMEHGGMGILHRHKEDLEDPIGHAVAIFKETVHLLESSPCLSSFQIRNIGVSVGVQEEDKTRFEQLYVAGARTFCIDVAHGHHILVKEMIEHMRHFEETVCETQRENDHYDDLVCIIAGNVATAKGAEDLLLWGADVVKIGIGPGEVCMTRRNTGTGVPQLHALKEIREAHPCIKMIADGGIKSTGDISKALVYANAVMIGSFIAGTAETPGHVYETPDGEYYKVYGGSASGERKVENGQSHKHVEGVVKMIRFNGKVKYKLRTIRENLQSAFSYSGANNLKEFQEKAILKEISGGAKTESKL